MEFDYNSDEIFLGSPSKIVRLNFISSKIWKFQEDELEIVDDNLHKMQTLQKLSDIGYCGKEYANVYVALSPCIEVTFKNSNWMKSPDELDGSIIAMPMIKNNSEKPDMIGFQSGKRSCIVKCKEKYYRLKGCGNLDFGFPLEKLLSNKPNSLEIRGCSYYNTSLREQYMTTQVNKVLNRYEIHCGNKPIGVWNYKNSEDFSRLKLENSCPLVDKFCGLFETIGEKRLASHLLQGVEVFLSYLTDKYRNEKLTRNFMISLFPKERQQIEDTANPIVPLEWLGPFLEIPEGKNLKEWTSGKVYPKESLEQVLDMEDKLKWIIKEIGNVFEISIIDQAVKGFIEAYDIPIEYHERFSKLAVSFLKNENMMELVVFLYCRVGWECGRIKRILQDNDIGWGYYSDHHPFFYHCNAHPNNFVILPPKNNKFILAPIDFDLAFMRDHFLNIDQRLGAYGENDQKVFDSFSNCERFELEHALSGEENMGNFAYSNMKLIYNDESTEQVFPILKKALRDTVVLNYRKAYDNYENTGMNNYKAFEDKNIYDLIRLSLIITRDVIA